MKGRPASTRPMDRLSSEGMRSLFWDVDPETFHPADNAAYVVERVLERGDQAAARWLRQAFSDEVITGVLRRSRRLSARSANFWALVFNVPRQEVRALSGSHDG